MRWRLLIVYVSFFIHIHLHVRSALGERLGWPLLQTSLGAEVIAMQKKGTKLSQREKEVAAIDRMCPCSRMDNPMTTADDGRRHQEYYE
jgi:hypothetical protein